MIEQVSEVGNVAQQRHLRDVDRVLGLDDATDHHRAAVGHQYLYWVGEVVFRHVRLSARGAALDVTAKYGLTALMLAVIRGHTEIVRRLVAAGADRNLLGTGAPGFSGKTALDFAAARGDAEQVAILGAGEAA